MTDHHLKSLRRAAATGGVEQQAALLRARMRAGGLSLARVRLAAFCEDPASRAVAHAGLDWTPPHELPAWLEYLFALGSDCDGVPLREEQCDECQGERPKAKLVGFKDDVRVTGFMCCCGGIDCVQTLDDPSHSLVHSCAYYGVECDCRLETTPCRSAAYEVLPCQSCYGSGPRRVPWPEWVMLKAAVAAARVAFEVWADVDDRDYRGGDVPGAIDAAARYLETGSLEDRNVAGAAWQTCSDTDWLPCPTGLRTRSREINAAAEETSDSDLRAAICSDLIEWCLS